jgi:hypothetical protein
MSKPPEDAQHPVGQLVSSNLEKKVMSLSLTILITDPEISIRK